MELSLPPFVALKLCLDRGIRTRKIAAEFLAFPGEDFMQNRVMVIAKFEIIILVLAGIYQVLAALRSLSVQRYPRLVAIFMRQAELLALLLSVVLLSVVVFRYLVAGVNMV